jgi:hypothetical protein
VNSIAGSIGATCALIILTLCACPRASAQKIPVAPTRQDAQFEYYSYDDVPVSAMVEIQQVLEDNYRRVLQDLDIDSLPRVRVRVWGNQRDFNTALDKKMNDSIESVMGYIVDEGDMNTIRLLYDGNQVGRRALHEFAHIASLAINESFANNPRWLWESFALYEAGQFQHPTQLSCITLSDVPSISVLDSPADVSTVVYQVGYLMGEFIVKKLGKDVLIQLISRNGNIESVLSMSDETFEREWHQFISDRYFVGSNRIPPILSEEQIYREVAGNTFYFEDGKKLYFARNHSITMELGSLLQSGRWYVRGGADVCWRVLNFKEFCTVFRRTNGMYWLDTPADCGRYSLRRVEGNPEKY